MNPYRRMIRPIDSTAAVPVDVYAVLAAFAVDCPATAHAVKKLLCAGQRGVKGREQDLREAGAAIARAVELAAAPPAET